MSQLQFSQKVSLLSLLAALEKGRSKFDLLTHKSLIGQGIICVPSRLGSRTENAPLTGAVFCTRDPTGNRTPISSVRGMCPSR